MHPRRTAVAPSTLSAGVGDEEGETNMPEVAARAACQCHARWRGPQNQIWIWISAAAAIYGNAPGGPAPFLGCESLVAAGTGSMTRVVTGTGNVDSSALRRGAAGVRTEI